MISGKLTKKQVESLGPGRHGDGNGLYLVVDPSGARRWIVRVVVKGQRNRAGGPLRTDFGLGGADVVTLAEARMKALEHRRLAKSGLHPRMHGQKPVPTFEEVARQVHAERLPTWKNAKHAAQWVSTLSEYAFPKIGRLPVSSIGQPEVLSCISPIWTSKHETARRVAQRISNVLDVARSKGFRSTENPDAAIMAAKVLPRIKASARHHAAMDWREVPAFYAALAGRPAMAAKALMFTCLTGARTGEALGARWDELDLEARLWTLPASRMKTGVVHRVPLSDAAMAILEPLKSLRSDVVFEGQRRHRPLSNMAMLMLLRRMGVEGVTVHGFRSAFRVWAAEEVGAPREVAEMSLAHQVGTEVERAYFRSDLLDRRRALMEEWARYVTGAEGAAATHELGGAAEE